ncbi:MAG TPA: HAMP domain-containing sensor histidine kinase [Candidatus Limnocylindrales bacterium]|nr:HAMP domain-containing sensor histidine kinase [Candidatus Limnocylindrales bacterium]
MAEITPERQAADADTDARLLRGVRWRLVLFSGGSTLLVLLVLGIGLYASAASSLESNGLASLERRAAAIQSFGQGPGGPRRPNSPIDVVFGGTFAILITPDGSAVGPRQIAIPGGLPDTEAASRADRSGRDVRTSIILVRSPGNDAERVQVRQLTVPLDTDEGRFFVQVIQDRTAEVQTLRSLVVVLVVGGLVVVLVAAGFGAVYARRALVPIRDSLTAQRAALQRQREFAADASHELRTPLTVIRSSVELLRRNAGRPVAEVGDALADIDAEVGELTGLVDDLLLLARSDSGAVTLQHVPLRLDDVATEAAAALAKPAADAGVRIEVDPAPTPAVGDPARLRQLVTILLDNAIRHSPREAIVRLAVRPLGQAASLAVDDAGPGVRPEDRERVFDRFWRAPGAPAGGTGLGLAIARWITEHHHGTISVQESDSGGARFEVQLPAAPASPPTRQAPEATS